MKETDIQAAICEYLTLKRVFFWRSNNIPVFSEGRFRAMPKFSRKGTPDIIAILPPNGQFLGIEVKQHSGRLSEHQQAFLRDCEAVGGRYLVAHDVQEVIDYFHGI